jgi:hypothetical protein
VARDVVALACAVSAGIHAALAPYHFAEGTAAGLGFAISAAALVLAGLIGSYALAITVGVPVLHPAPERVDGLALATKAIEAIGLLAAAYVVSAAGSPAPCADGTPVVRSSAAPTAAAANTKTAPSRNAAW